MMSDYRTEGAARLDAAELGRRAGFPYVPVRMRWTDKDNQPLYGAIPAHQYEAHLSEAAEYGWEPNFIILDEPGPAVPCAVVTAAITYIAARDALYGPPAPEEHITYIGEPAPERIAYQQADTALRAALAALSST